MNRRDYGVGNGLGNPTVFSAIEPNSWFRIAIKVYDTAGRTWRLQSSQWTLDNDYPQDVLPVTLKSFEAQEQGGHARLQWQTATETNNLGFEVQGSTNGMEFEKLGFVPSLNANSLELNNYSFLDQAFSYRKSPVYYYRLKQVDLDGTVEYSKIVALNKTPGKASVLPIPFNKEIVVSLEALTKGATEISLMDITGKTVHRQNFPVQPGLNSLKVLPASHLPDGVYFIQFETKGKMVRVKTLKH
jgi:hypothetical protein